MLVDKDHLPNWNPKFVKDVTDEMVGKFFCSLGKNEWKVKQAANITRLESAKLELMFNVSLLEQYEIVS